MEWARVVELWRPMRTLVVEGSRNLGDPCQRGDGGGWIVPVDFYADFLRICFDAGVGVLHELNKPRDILSVSAQGFRSSLMGPPIQTQGSVTRVVKMHGAGHV